MRDKPLAVATILFFMIGNFCLTAETLAQLPSDNQTSTGGVSASYSGISDADLVDLRLKPQLKRLHVKDSKITDAGLARFFGGVLLAALLIQDSFASLLTRSMIRHHRVGRDERICVLLRVLHHLTLR